MTGVGLSRSLRQLREAVSRYPLLAAALALTMLALASVGYAEVIPTLAPVAAWSYFTFLHALHDLLALLVALYVVYRLLPALGAGLLLLFVALHVPYFYLGFPADLPEALRTASTPASPAT